MFTFNSEYGEEDIIDTLAELIPSSSLVSRVRVSPLSADHFCTLEVKTEDENFQWPAMKKVDADVFRNLVQIA